MAANGCERSVQRKECWWQMTSNNLQATELTTCSYLSLITDNGWFLFIMVGAKRKYIISQINVDKNRYEMTWRDKMWLFMSYELCQQVSWNIFSGESFTKSLNHSYKMTCSLYTAQITSVLKLNLGSIWLTPDKSRHRARHLWRSSPSFHSMSLFLESHPWKSPLLFIVWISFKLLLQI